MAGLFLSGAAALTAGVLKWGSRKAELEAYSLALERVLETKVVRRALYFLHAGMTVDL